MANEPNIQYQAKGGLGELVGKCRASGSTDYKVCRTGQNPLKDMSGNDVLLIGSGLEGVASELSDPDFGLVKGKVRCVKDVPKDLFSGNYPLPRIAVVEQSAKLPYDGVALAGKLREKNVPVVFLQRDIGDRAKLSLNAVTVYTQDQAVDAVECIEIEGEVPSNAGYEIPEGLRTSSRRMREIAEKVPERQEMHSPAAYTSKSRKQQISDRLNVLVGRLSKLESGEDTHKNPIAEAGIMALKETIQLDSRKLKALSMQIF